MLMDGDQQRREGSCNKNRKYTDLDLYKKNLFAFKR